MLIYIMGLILSNVVFILATERFMGVFFEKRRTAFSVMAFFYLLFLISLNLERLFLSVDISHILITIPMLFIIALNYESSMLKRSVAVACNYFLFAVTITLVSRFSDFLPASFLNGETYKVGVLFLVLGSMASYLIALLLRQFKSIRKNNAELPVFWVFALLILISMIAIFVLYSFNINTFFLLPAILLAFMLVFFYMYNSLSVAYEDKLKAALYSQEREYYLTQLQLMQDSAKEIKSIQHDMRNHLITLKDYSIKGEPRDITDYLERLLVDVERSDIYSDTGNLVFDSIINHKLRNTKRDHVKLNLRLSIPSVLNMEVTDIVTVLGNLLDNALDAVAKVEEKTLMLDIEFDKGCLYVKIENSFNGEVKYSGDKAGKESHIVSQKSRDGHGYGLNNIRQTVKKYNGHVKIAHSESIFSVRILLYVDDK